MCSFETKILGRGYHFQRSSSYLGRYASSIGTFCPIEGWFQANQVVIWPYLDFTHMF
jgi:hypothetical protein